METGDKHERGRGPPDRLRTGRRGAEL